MAKYFLLILSVVTDPLNGEHVTILTAMIGFTVINRFEGQKETDNQPSPHFRKLTCGTCGNLFPVMVKVTVQLYDCTTV